MKAYHISCRPLLSEYRQPFGTYSNLAALLYDG